MNECLFAITITLAKTNTYIQIHNKYGDAGSHVAVFPWPPVHQSSIKNSNTKRKCSTLGFHIWIPDWYICSSSQFASKIIISTISSLNYTCMKSQRNKAIQRVIHVPGICLNLVPKMRTSSMIHDVAFSQLYFDPHQNPVHNQTYFLRK